MPSRSLSPQITGQPTGQAAGPALDRDPLFCLGKYEIIKRLAKGGMAEIFLAYVRGTVPGFRKVVVIKRILPEYVKQPSFVGMFIDEARLAATLQHPNIVQVFDVGVEDGQYDMAMEYLHGEDVRSLMRAAQNKIPIEHAIHVALGLCAGLHYAHEKVGFEGRPLNIVHRDVSPQNVIVTFDGAVKLLDFGIAKAENQVSETRIGQLKGKVPYMSPEQCVGDPLDRRSDIYSLGIFLYELTVGRRLYQGKSDYDVMKEIVDGRITPPREIDPLYHPTLEAIVMRALEKDRDRRFQTVREMQAEIELLARKSHLYVSPTGLQEYMAQLYGGKIEAWREAQAQGRSLIEHLETLLFQVPAKDSEVGEKNESGTDKKGAAGPKREPSGPIKKEPSGPRDRLETPYELPVFRSEDKNAVPPPPLLPRTTPSVSVSDDILQTGVAVSQSLGSPASASPPRLRNRTLRPSPPAPNRGPRPRLMRLGMIAIPTAILLVLAGAYGHSKWRSLHGKASMSLPVAQQAAMVVAPEPSRTIEYGIVKVESRPTGATLFLDGKKLDHKTPATVDRVEVGPQHVLLVQVADHDDVVELFTLEPGGVLPLSIKLEPSRRSLRIKRGERIARNRITRRLSD